jgi:hypothetical protein
VDAIGGKGIGKFSRRHRKHAAFIDDVNDAVAPDMPMMVKVPVAVPCLEIAAKM